MAKRPRKPTSSDQGDLFARVEPSAPAATRLPEPSSHEPRAAPSGEHGRYGVEPACGECGGPTIIAKHYLRSTTEPSIVQARCRRLTCKWQGERVTLLTNSPDSL